MINRSAYRTCKMSKVIYWQAKRWFVITYFPQGLQQEKYPDPSNFSRSVPHTTSLNATPQKQAERVQRYGRRIRMHKIRWLHRFWNQLIKWHKDSLPCWTRSRQGWHVPEWHTWAQKCSEQFRRAPQMSSQSRDPVWLQRTCFLHTQETGVVWPA